MQSKMIEVETPDGVADCYLAQPAGDGEPHPGVLFLIDVHGLRPQIERMADRVADQGYVVLVPNLFYRAGRAPLTHLPEDMSDPAQRGPYMEQVLAMARTLTPQLIAADGDAYIAALESLGNGRVAIAGYCLGARLGFVIAASHPGRVAGLAGFHVGGMVTDAADSPHLRAPDVRCEVYFGHADNDANNTAEQIATLDRALEDAGVTHRTEVYHGAPHGYTMADTPSYDEAAAERHYSELFALLERTTAARAA